MNLDSRCLSLLCPFVTYKGSKRIRYRKFREKGMEKQSSNALESPGDQAKTKNPEDVLVVSHLGDDDVLLGRGKRPHKHVGNIKFRGLVLERAAAYRANENKSYRKAVAIEIMKLVAKRGGKFLKADKNASNRWEVVSVSVVRTKVKQALRDAAFSLSLPPDQKQSGGAASRNSDATLPSRSLSGILHGSPDGAPDFAIQSLLAQHSMSLQNTTHMALLQERLLQERSAQLEQERLGQLQQQRLGQLQQIMALQRSLQNTPAIVNNAMLGSNNAFPFPSDPQTLQAMWMLESHRTAQLEAALANQHLVHPSLSQLSTAGRNLMSFYQSQSNYGTPHGLAHNITNPQVLSSAVGIGEGISPLPPRAFLESRRQQSEQKSEYRESSSEEEDASEDEERKPRAEP